MFKHKETASDWRGGLPLSTGIAALIFLVLVLGFWGARARISGAVVANGLIQVESNRQVIEHLDGGVVGDILVKDGDVVEAGQVLIRLNGTRSKSELAIVEGQLREIEARQARLVAERDDATDMDFTEELLDHAYQNPVIMQKLEGEVTLFNARRDAMYQEIALLDEQDEQIQNRIAGIEAQLSALRTQKSILDQELQNQQELLDQQLIQAARVLELKREEADLLGQIGRLEADIAELRGQLTSNDIALLQLETRRREEAVSTLRDLQFRQVELLERQSSLRDTISRLGIRAPVGGIIYNSQVFAVQSVVQPAEPLMYIIPQDRPLVVSARIDAINVDEVYLGQEAALRFSAFDQRLIPEINGQLSKISADVTVDENTGQHYYVTEILPLEDEIGKLGDETLLPGMPVEVFIKTGDRTAFEYLTEPLMGFFNRAFRE